MQALLVTLIELFILFISFLELFLNYKPSASRGEPGTWDAGQTGKSKLIDKKSVRGFPEG
jgi:hypothetical protein